MKLVITLSFIFCIFKLNAQSLNGRVIDRSTRLPVANARISTTYQNATTNNTGIFRLNTAHVGDTVLVEATGYVSFHSIINKSSGDTLKIYLSKASVLLKPVTVFGKHDAGLDSLRLRQEYASTFINKNRVLKDAFITRSPNLYKPYDNLTAPNNTTAILSVNALQLVNNIFSKKKGETSKLQKVLLKEEENDFVNRTFNRQLVTQATGLKGDSLQSFINRYRPTATQLKSMTSYDLIVYVKNNYQTFKQPAKAETANPQ
ncbi:carboxypeptidase-like regulatory domain-containing protein [Mucilaginibacter lacusdianchii]|uniref:carboxypeptidase-like regulatory domain-containing protein n=1 Tax=Mucilaginibacter lacusdianchii TaxID=2684211 RepID=UPI00131C7719|nr:carboxypeptidase-like regulatory domain-containing protein [Mucilaginibacter sp. JXJ CY 39]